MRELKSSTIKKLILLVEDLALCENHMTGCLAKTHLVDENYECSCFNKDYFNFENMIKKAREIVGEI